MKNNLALSYIEISKKNLIHNIKQFRGLLNGNTKISVCIKGNAYGHGQNVVAKILEPHVDYFQINSVGELELLRKVSKKKVLLLGYVQNSELPKAVKLGCILTVFSIKQLWHISAIAQICHKVQEVHIPVDAHLGREGFLLSELPEVFAEIKKSKFVKATGMYAHFANIEDTRDFSHAQKQINEYQKALEIVKEFGFKNPRQGGASLQTHISATSGILAYEKRHGINSIVRLGIGVYGLWPSTDLQKKYDDKINFKPVLSWKTKVAQVKTLPKGHTVGYGLTYKTKKETKIAIIPQGYADGFGRGFSNKGEVLIGGTKCRVVGRVSMNMFAVDVSHLKNLKVEDEVVILGKQGKEIISAEEMAKTLETINYEITARISALLPRIII